MAEKQRLKERKIKDLQEELRWRQLKVGGRRKELEDRLAEAKDAQLQLNAVDYLLLLLLLLSRALGARYHIATDCDEVFNYIEPVHYLIHGYGLQTWENHGAFALRSWLYHIVHAIPPAAAQKLELPKEMQLLSSRIACSMACLFAEVIFARAIRSSVGLSASRFFVLLATSNAGIFVAAPSPLPNATAMSFLSLACSSALLHLDLLACALSAVCVLFTWPFAGVAAIPLGVLSLLDSSKSFLRRFLHTSGAILGASASVMVLSVAADQYYYQRVTSSIVNLVKYNVFSNKGSSLYGTEPISYYGKNLLLNMNVVTLLCMLQLLVERRYTVNLCATTLKKGKKDDEDNVSSSYARAKRYLDSDRIMSATCLPCFCLLLTMLTVQHKEERFLYPVYTSFLASAAITIDRLWHMDRKNVFRRSINATVCTLIVLLHSVLGTSRAASVVMAHSGTNRLLDRAGLTSEPVDTICYRDIWHRFPSHFYLHRKSSAKSTVAQFVPGGFQGALPVPFNASDTDKAALNDENKLKPEMQLDSMTSCEYAVLLDKEMQDTTISQQLKQFATIETESVLSLEESPALTRSFYIPYLWQERNSLIHVHLLAFKGGAQAHAAASSRGGASSSSSDSRPDSAKAADGAAEGSMDADAGVHARSAGAQAGSDADATPSP